MPDKTFLVEEQISDLKRKSRLADMPIHKYWRECVAPDLLTMPPSQRYAWFDLAYHVSMSIIPFQRLDNALLPTLLNYPVRASIPWNELTREYGVDRRYIATAYAAALERYIVKTGGPAFLTRRDEQGVSPFNAILSICVSGNMDRQYINEMVATNKFNYTLGTFDPERVIENARTIDEKLRRRLRAKKERNAMYPKEETWALWKSRRARTIRDKADRITQALLNDPNHQANPLKVLARLLTTFTHASSPKLGLASIMLYAHRHVVPRLRILAPDLIPIINAHALHFARASLTSAPAKHLAALTVIAQLTSTPGLLPFPFEPDSKAQEMARAWACSDTVQLTDNEA